MRTRSSILQGFLDLAQSSVDRASRDVQTARSIDGVFARLRGAGASPRATARRLPTCDCLPEALAIARSRPDLAPLVDAFETLEPLLAWATRTDGPCQSDDFPNGHANAMIVGPGGLEERDDVWIGTSLLRPHVRYPDHRHPPEEVYLILAPGAFRQADGEWFEPAIGGTFYNEPGILHAMRAGATPLFALWFLLPDSSP